MATVTRVVGNKAGNGEDARKGGMMVAIGHVLCVNFCVCGETTKNNAGYQPFFHESMEKHIAP